MLYDGVMVEHRRRIVDDELDVLLGLPAIAVEGPKGVGKTATATIARTRIERAITLCVASQDKFYARGAT